MRAVHLHSAGDLRLHDDEQVPEIASGETLLRVTSVGLCGSDLHWFAEAGIGDARLAKPLVLGHEFTAMTDAGDRVAVDPAVPCGVCEFCCEGNPNLCDSLRFAGHGEQDGALREFMAWPARNMFPLQSALSDEDGVMLEPLGVALHAVSLADLQPGMLVGVFGCGPVGLLVLQVARLLGAPRVFAAEKLPHRMLAAQAFGAIVHEARGYEGAEILELTKGRGVDVAFEAAGENSAVESAITAVKPGAGLF